MEQAQDQVAAALEPLSLKQLLDFRAAAEEGIPQEDSADKVLQAVILLAANIDEDLLQEKGSNTGRDAHKSPRVGGQYGLTNGASLSQQFTRALQKPTTLLSADVVALPAGQALRASPGGLRGGKFETSAGDLAAASREIAASDLAAAPVMRERGGR